VLRLIADGHSSERELFDEIVRFLDLTDAVERGGGDSAIENLRYKLAVLFDLGLIEPVSAC